MPKLSGQTGSRKEKSCLHCDVGRTTDCLKMSERGLARPCSSERRSSSVALTVGREGHCLICTRESKNQRNAAEDHQPPAPWCTTDIIWIIWDGRSNTVGDSIEYAQSAVWQVFECNWNYITSISTAGKCPEVFLRRVSFIQVKVIPVPGGLTLNRTNGHAGACAPPPATLLFI